MYFFSRIAKRIKWIFHRRYEYFYINNVVQNTNNKIDTVFIGPSYVVFGINPTKTSVVLSLPSQDIYYSIQLLKKYLCHDKSNIKRVVMGLGYWGLYHDLSSVKSFDELNRIFDVYYPVLGDLHNMPSERYAEAEGKFGFINKVIETCLDKTVFYIMFLGGGTIALL